MGRRKPAIRRGVVYSADESLQRVLAALEGDVSDALSALDTSKLSVPEATPVRRSNYTASVGDLVLCNPTDGPFQVDLPALRKADAGATIVVKNVSTSTNAITVAAGPGNNIDSGDSVSIAASKGCVRAFFDGVNWWSV